MSIVDDELDKLRREHKRLTADIVVALVDRGWLRACMIGVAAGAGAAVSIIYLFRL